MKSLCWYVWWRHQHGDDSFYPPIDSDQEDDGDIEIVKYWKKKVQKGSYQILKDIPDDDSLDGERASVPMCQRVIAKNS